MGKILSFRRSVNGVAVEQRTGDGFINATAMCAAHGKKLDTWLRTQDALDFFIALAMDLGLEIKYSDLSNLDPSRLSARKYAEIFPGLVFTKQGAPNTGGGTWFHPDVALQLAQWCNKLFAIQVSRWIREWLTTGKSPIAVVDPEAEWVAWQQRYDIRIQLKDYLRPELMNSVVKWAEQNGVNPRTLCSKVHDAMNERIQGAKAQQIRLMGGLPLGALLRDYFEISPLACYAAINRIAKNAIDDRGIEPLAAVHEACDVYLGKTYVPKLVSITENLYSQGRRLKSAKKQRQLAAGIQLNLLDNHQDQAS